MPVASWDHLFDARNAVPILCVSTLLVAEEEKGLAHWGEGRGCRATGSAEMTSHRFVGRVAEIFNNDPKPLA